jgi:hypothetical protein
VCDRRQYDDDDDDNNNNNNNNENNITHKIICSLYVKNERRRKRPVAN